MISFGKSPMNRLLKVGSVAAVAMTVAACGTVQSILPFNLGGSPEAESVASAGERIPVIEFDQALAPSAALAGRDFFLPGPQSVVSWPNPGGTPDNSVEHVIAAESFSVAWRRNIGAGAGRTSQVMAPPVAEGGRIFVMDGEASVSALDARNGGQIWKVNLRPEGRERGGFGRQGLRLVGLSTHDGPGRGDRRGGVAVAGRRADPRRADGVGQPRLCGRRRQSDNRLRREYGPAGVVLSGHRGTGAHHAGVVAGGDR
jgi:hypothetical protein